MNRVLLFLLVLVLFSYPLFGRKNQDGGIYQIRVKGRVVDSRNNAVDRALIILLSSGATRLFTHFKSNQKGEFSGYVIPMGKAYRADIYALQTLEGADDRDANFFALVIILKSSASQPKQISNLYPNAGDIPVSGKWGVLQGRVVDKTMNPIKVSARDWKTVQVQVSDTSGTVLCSVPIDPFEVSKKPSFHLALPEGRWNISVSGTRDQVKWQSSIIPIEVKNGSSLELKDIMVDSL